MNAYLKISVANGQTTLEGPADLPSILFLLSIGANIAAQIAAREVEAEAMMNGTPRVLLADGSLPIPGMN